MAHHTFCKILSCALAGGLLLSLSACSQQQMKAFIDSDEPYQVKHEWDGWWSQLQSDVSTFGGQSRVMGTYAVDSKTQLCFFIASSGVTQIPCAKLANREEWEPIITW